MRLKFHIHQFNSALLLCIFFLLGYSLAHAQEKSVTDTIAHVMKNHKDYTRQCKALYDLGAYYFNIGDPESALIAMNQSKAIAEKHKYYKGLYDAYAILGAIYLRQGDINKVRSIVREGLELANDQHDEYGVNRAKYLLTTMYYQQGMIDSAILISKAVLEGPHTVYDSATLPKFNVFLGNVYLAKGDLQHANNCYIEALDIAEKTNNEPLITVCLGNLAIIHDELKNFREALKYLQKVELIARRNNQMQPLGSVYNSMGGIYRNLQIPDSALIYFKKALHLHTQFGGLKDIAITHSNIGPAMAELNQPDSGLHYLLLAKEELKVLKDSIGIANNALMLGAAWRQMGQNKKDRSYFELAQKELNLCQIIAEKKGIEDLKMKCYHQQAVLYEAMGNESKAFHYLKLYSLINDSIRSEEYTRQIAEMQTKYEADKKETEIAKLNAENLLGVEKINRQRILNYSLLAMAGLILTSGSVIFRNVKKKRVAERQVAILEKQNAIESMRTKIASDVHDEMGANLTRLGLNAQQLLQSSDVPEKEKLLAEKMNLQSKEIITGMREIIWSSNPANDNLKSMLGFMRQYIDRFFDGTNIRPIVNFPHDAGEVTLHPEVRRNLFLILKESLNNAMKYSDSDRVDIDFNNKNEKFNLKIKDYGKGIDDKNIDDFSNGIRNMQMRAEQIQSLFNIITAPGQGVQIMVEGKLY